VGHVVQVVQYDDDAGPCPGSGAQAGQRFQLVAGIEIGQRFFGEQPFGRAGQHTRQQHPVAFAARQGGDWAPGKGDDIGSGHRRGDGGPVGLGLAPAAPVREAAEPEQSARLVPLAWLS